jgi:hypothetical protein
MSAVGKPVEGEPVQVCDIPGRASELAGGRVDSLKITLARR